MIPHLQLSPSNNFLIIKIYIYSDFIFQFYIFSTPLYDHNSYVYSQKPHIAQLLTKMELNSHKKLRKLPHVFGKVLELPFRSDADVAVEEGPDFFRFVVNSKAGNGVVRAHAVEIHPGVIKIVVRNDHKLSCGVELFLDKLELDTWRFRLPSSALPELATAAFVDGKLVVTVPKGGDKRMLPNVYTFPFLPQNFYRYKMGFT